jgi:PadR family transcriptional regulator PadR
MEATLSTAAGVLALLTDGPRYGRDLIRLLSVRAAGVINPRPGTVYRAFDSLARRGLLRSWTVVPGGQRGARSRKYYELTPEGIAAAERQRQALAAFLDVASPRPSPADAGLMGARLRRASEARSFALKLQRGVRHAAAPKRS